MTLQISAVQTFKNRAVLDVIAHLWDIGASLPFDRSYISANTYGDRFQYPGMLVSFNADKTKYVPWSAAASYGTYSSYLEGILYTLYEHTFQEQVVAPATRAAVVVANCYVYGGTLGDIPMTARSATSITGVQIQWDE